jgi:hypothetical protein
MFFLVHQNKWVDATLPLSIEILQLSIVGLILNQNAIIHNLHQLNDEFLNSKNQDWPLLKLIHDIPDKHFFVHKF